jgi:hypothetical protein
MLKKQKTDKIIVKNEILEEPLCSDSNVCLNFGKQDEQIKELFDYFVSFDSNLVESAI